LLDLLEQADVLDGDDGLVGECFEKGYLLVCKRTNFCAANHNRPKRHALSYQWRSKYRPSTSASLEFPGLWKLGIKLSCNVMDVNGLSVDDRSAAYMTSGSLPGLTNVVGCG